MIPSSHIPTTGRKTSFQAKQLGFSSVAALADSLLPNAVVADIGAGLSRLGHEVAALRPDILWLNLDPCYNHEAMRRTATQSLPINVELLPLDIVNETPELTQHYGTINLVYSYWLLPHLSLEDDSTARAAVMHMHQLLAPNGRLIVGPVRRLGIGLLSPYRYKGTVTHTQADPPQQVADDIVVQTKLWWLPRFIQRLGNRHNVHVGVLFVGGKIKL